jgi:bacteriorhodopsin
LVDRRHFRLFSRHGAFSLLGYHRPCRDTRHFYIIAAVITGVAAFSYLMMPTGAGATLVGGDRVFYSFATLIG